MSKDGSEAFLVFFGEDIFGVRKAPVVLTERPRMGRATRDVACSAPIKALNGLMPVFHGRIISYGISALHPCWKPVEPFSH